MIPVIHDSTTVARAQISKELLGVFLQAPDADFAKQWEALSKREGVVVCYKNRVRVKRLTGHWFQISGYREDGNDLELALFALRNAERILERRGQPTAGQMVLAACCAS